MDTKTALKMIAIFVDVVILEAWAVWAVVKIIKDIETALEWLGITPTIRKAWERWKKSRRKRKEDRERARKDHEYREAVEKIIEDWKEKEK